MDLSACTCPFCGRKRHHGPPSCHCTACGDGVRGNATHPVEIRIAEIPPPSKDVADLLTSTDGVAKYDTMVRNARPGPSWMIGHLDEVRGHDLETVRGKVAAAEDMVDVLLRQPPIARAEYVRELANKLCVGEREVRQTLNQALRQREAYYTANPEQRPKPTPVWERDAL